MRREGTLATSWLSAAFLVLTCFSMADAQVGSPAGPVPPDLLEARRQALLDSIGNGVAVVRSTDLRDIEADYPQDSDFRQDNDFFYLTGLETAESWLLLVARENGADEIVLYLPPRDRAEEQWTGPKLGPGEEAARITGIADVRSSESAEAEILRRIREDGGGRVLLEVGQAELRAFEAELAEHGAEASDLRPQLAAVRLIKDADEIDRLRTAIGITTEAQREAMRAAHGGLWEYELEAIVEYTFRRRGAERVGFPSIVGSGPNSTVLHYDKSRRRTESGDLVVVDIGAEYGYYTADVTRTFPVSGRFTPRQRELYELVLGAQQAAIEATRPGVTIRELDGVARRYMRENSGTLCAPRTCDQYFAHGLSHWLGLDVHDVGDYSTPLAAGMVFTIEPGLYIADEEIGIRIEDDILVTETGAVVLSDDAPRAANDIEALMAEEPRCCVVGGGGSPGAR